MKLSTNTSLLRWLDLIPLTVIACLIYFFLMHVLEPFVSKVFGVLGLLPLPVRWLIYSLIFAVVWWPVVHRGGFSLGSFLTIFQYPPFWLACIFGIILIWFVRPYIPFLGFVKVPRTSFLSLLFPLGAAAVSAGILKVCHEFPKWLTSSKDKPRKPSTESIIKPITEDIKELLQWIVEETPISTPDQDALNTKLFAIRITEILSGAPLKTVSLVGGYGAGKSSILNMIQNYMHDNNGEKGGSKGQKGEIYQFKDIIHVKVCGWGLQKGTAAESILKHVVQGCAQHVDCFGLSNLPAQY